MWAKDGAAKARRVPKARIDLNAIVIVCVFVVEGNVSWVGSQRRGSDCELECGRWECCDVMGGGSTQDIGAVTTMERTQMQLASQLGFESREAGKRNV